MGSGVTLGDKRRRMSKMLSLLEGFAALHGYELAYDYNKRCQDCPIGHQNSLHKLGLAMDINLYKDGKYLEETEDHLILGEFWEYIGGTWGGRFDDGNHYSIEFRGMK